MSNGIKRYQCPACGNYYAMMLPEGKCPCGGALIDTLDPLSVTDGLWFEEAFETFPCVIAHEYKRLYELQQQKNNYGVLLQLKDVIEATIKFLTLAACAWGKSKGIEGREEAYEKELAREGISLGHWKNIAGMTAQFYADLADTPNTLPVSLFHLLSQVKDWVEGNNLVNWRNRRIGHGAVACENDPKFVAELRNVIQSVTDFYKKNTDDFKAIQVISNDHPLLGAASARGLASAAGECKIAVNGVSYSTTPYIVHEDHGIFFFDEVVRRKRARLLNYPTGDFKEHRNEYAAHLSDILRKQDNLLSHDLNIEFMSEEENDYLSRFGCDEDYVEPKHLTNWLRTCITEHSKGIFLLEMERGCGKTFFTEKLNHRFPNPQYLDKDIDIRTYHFSRSQFGGVEEFINSVSNEWKYAFGSSPVVGTIRLEQDKDNPANNAALMCEFLKKWHAYTERNRSRNSVAQKRIMLVLDGLDEITDSNARIWTYIPTSYMLPEGVYILLTGRNTETDDVTASYVERISHLDVLERKCLSANAQENTELLRQFISQKQLPSADENLINHLIRASEGKILLLSMLCNQVKLDGASSLTGHGLNAITQSYLSMLEVHYNEQQKHIFRNVLVVLSTCGAYEALSISELADMILMGSIKLELYDVLSDLMPLLTVERGIIIDEELQSDVNRYHFSNTNISEAMKTYLGGSIKSVLETIADSMIDEIDDDAKIASYSNGILCFLAHIYEILDAVSLTKKLLSKSVVHNMKEYAAYVFEQQHEVPGSLVNARYFSVLEQMLHIGEQLTKYDLIGASHDLWNAADVLSAHFMQTFRYEKATDVMMFQQKLTKLKCGIPKEDTLMLTIKQGTAYRCQNNPKAEHYLTKAASMLSLAAKESVDMQAVLAHVVSSLADFYAENKQFGHAEERYAEAEKLYMQLGESCQDYKLKLDKMKVDRVRMILAQGNAEQIEQAEQTVRDIRQHLFTQYSQGQDQYSIDLAYVDSELADWLRNKGRYEESQMLHEEAMTIYEKLVDNGHTEYKLLLAKVCTNTGVMYKKLKEYEKAEGFYKRAYDIYQHYAKLSPAGFSADVAMVAMDLGNLYSSEKKYKDAELYYAQAVQMKCACYEMNPNQYACEYSEACLNFAKFLHKKKGNLIEAEKYYRTVISVCTPQYRKNPTYFARVYIGTCLALSHLLRMQRGSQDEETLQLVKVFWKSSGNAAMTESTADFENIAEYQFLQDVKHVMCGVECMTPENGWTPDAVALVLSSREDGQVDEPELMLTPAEGRNLLRNAQEEYPTFQAEPDINKALQFRQSLDQAVANSPGGIVDNINQMDGFIDFLKVIVQGMVK